PVIGPDGLKDEAFVKMAGADCEGVYTSYPSDTSKLPAYVQAREAHLKKFGAEPGSFYYNAYSATQALLNAIEKAGSTETTKIVDALHNNFVETPSGKLKFNKHGDAAGVGLSIYQIQHGKFVELDHKLILE
ncbi:MAG: ABC transporter substrate-binding protein, partial [Desulfovibrionaceae bacterium]